MISKILIIADATTEAVELILELLKTIHSDPLHVKTLFISRLFGGSLKHLGPNILTLLMREEKEAPQRVRVYFTMNDIPYDIQIMPGSDWQVVSKEVEADEHHLLILQGKFANLWRKDHPSTCGSGAITGSADSVWILDSCLILMRKTKHLP
jgi:hypothetical protein